MLEKKGALARLLKWTLIGLAIAFAGIQFLRPAKSNPTVDNARTIEAHTRMTPEVAAIFERSCNDCHSNKTVWPWYSNVAPVSWFVVDHVNHGRHHLNFSEWARFDQEEAQGMLKEICSEAKSGSMPLKSYTRIHTNAKLSEKDVEIICGWARRESQHLGKQAKSSFK